MYSIFFFRKWTNTTDYVNSEIKWHSQSKYKYMMYMFIMHEENVCVPGFSKYFTVAINKAILMHFSLLFFNYTVHVN